MFDDLDLDFRKSTFCSGGDCLEIARKNGKVYVRNNQRPDDIVEYSEQGWGDLIVGVKRGEFEAVS